MGKTTTTTKKNIYTYIFLELIMYVKLVKLESLSSG